MKIKSRIRRALDMKFSDPKMQEEFTVLKEQNSARDFNATVIFLITMNLLIIFPGIAKDDHTNTIVAAVIIGVIVVVCGIRRFFSRHVQYFTLLALFFFNLSRFVIIGLSYDTYSKIGMYIQGYMFGALQCVVLTRINNLYHKIIFIAISLGLRYGILIGILDPARYSTMTLLRQFVVDSFIIFMFYSDDSTERKIFQNFFENRDELTKFKELLTDSFPQSVTVIDSTTQKTLFANNAFMTTFNNYSGEQSPAIVETGTLSSRQMNTNGRMKTDPTENYLKHLHIDLNTLRDLETLRSDFDTFMSNSNNYVTLEELLNKLVQHNLLNYSIMSMAASCCDPGKSRTFDVVLKKIKWDRVDAIAIILNDITYQENLIALKLANANKDKLIATVSHELRTPLHGIIGLLEISQTKVQDKEIQHHLSLCKDNAMLLHSLVNSMLDLQQLSTGKLRLNIGKVNMNKVLNDVAQLFKFQCSEKKIELKVVVSENVPECITSDENRLKQVLINLIGNAIKFTFKGGITIEADQDPEDQKQLEVSVTDTGIGIKDDDKHKLFKMYGKLDDAEGVNKNGIGLGLTISSTLASLLNGRSSDKGIELASKYGEGSKFSFKVHKDLESLKSISSDQNLDRLVGGKKEDEDSKVRKNSSGLNLIHEHKLEESVTGGEMNEDTGSMVRLEEKLASYSHFPQKETMRDLKRKLTNSRQSPSRIDHFSIAIDDKSIMTTSAVAKRPSFSKQPSQEPLNLNQSEAEPNGEKMDINHHTFLKLKSLNENECILVVDDNPFNLLVAKNLIKELGYNVKAATGGPEAIEAVKTSIKDGETIKVIFMDCQMPIMDGFETTRSLKKMMENDEIPAIPILAWTANNGEEDVRRCYECGMSGYLMKPTTQAAILKAISQ